ncbi:hypothetical protein GCM10020218_048140 [Dactylosporangium vinaceum]
MAFAVALAVGLAGLVGPGEPAAAAVYVPIAGGGSTMAYNAFRAWIGDVAQYGMRVDYERSGSAVGRAKYRNGLLDFAVSDTPYGLQDGTSSDPPPDRGFGYMPVTAGGTAFMYNLTIGGQRVTDLRLSGENVAKIFTGRLTRWNDPAIAADNPRLALPDTPIVPVVRTDADGSTYALTRWMSVRHGQYWTAYCATTGRSPCTPTQSYPVLGGSAMVGQPGDLGVSGYVSQPAANGAIGYVQYSYALQAGFPVAKLLNAAGYYTEPTAGHVGVSLGAAAVDPATGIANLDPVYRNPDPRTYELSGYAYAILPTDNAYGFTNAKGYTLGAFGSYALCQGQRELARLGYAPLPASQVRAGYAQLQKVPGAQLTAAADEFAAGCPTVPDPAGDPMPAACDRLGPTQCLGVGGEPQSVTGRETIQVNVEPEEGVFTMTVEGGPVVMSTAVLRADHTFESTGRLGVVTIDDGRDQTRPGWSVSGQVGDFTSGADTFSGGYLGWTPRVVVPNAAGDATAGPGGAINAGGALGTGGLGTTVLGADLTLKVPSSTRPGRYSATLTITAIAYR